MTISWLTGPQAVDVNVAGVQAAASANVDASKGSVTLAFAQGCRAIVLWLQALVAGALAKSRFATSYGPDVDSWMADFGQRRAQAVASTTSVIMAPLTPGAAATVKVGSLISTGPGGTQFAVIQDTTNAAWSPSAGAYVLTAGATSITVPVQCAVAGSVGNVLQGAINSFVTPIKGIDTVANPSAVTNGVDAASDDAAKQQMQLFFPALASAVPAAILRAAYGVQQGVRLQHASAFPMPGFYTLWVDDGSGAAPDSFITAVTAAVQAVSAEGIQPVVMRPTINNVSVTTSLQVPSAFRSAAVVNANTAIAKYAATLQPGDGLPLYRLAAVIEGADSNITGLSSLALNGAATDVAGAQGVLIAVSPEAS